MTPDEISATFAVLPPGEQAEVLAVLAHELTVLARDGYEVGGVGLSDPKRVRAINEVQHRVCGHLVKLLLADTARYPDDVLVRILLDNPDQPGLSGQVAWAFGRAFEAVAQHA